MNLLLPTLQVYVAPHWFGPSKEEEKLSALQKSIDQLNKNMEELLKTMQTTQTNLADMARTAASTRVRNSKTVTLAEM